MVPPPKLIIRVTRALPPDTSEDDILRIASDVQSAAHNHHMDMCASCIGSGDPGNRDVSSVVMSSRDRSLKLLRDVVSPLGWEVQSAQDGTRHQFMVPKVIIVDASGCQVYPTPGQSTP